MHKTCYAAYRRLTSGMRVQASPPHGGRSLLGMGTIATQERDQVASGQGFERWHGTMMVLRRRDSVQMTWCISRLLI